MKKVNKAFRAWLKLIFPTTSAGGAVACGGRGLARNAAQRLLTLVWLPALAACWIPAGFQQACLAQGNQTQASQTPASQGQTQWEFVSGSRQARPVTRTTAQPNQAQPGTYMTTPRVTRGMQLLTAPRSRTGIIQATGQPRQAAAPVQPTQQRSAATDKVGRQKAYDVVDRVTVDGVDRIYRTHIPASYDRAKPTPVVLAFHGLGMDSLSMMGMSGFNGLSDRKGFIVVYGEGLNRRWNDGNGGGADDIGYVSAVLQKLTRIANIDQKRIYACGISNGGFFTQRLACAMADKIAAAAVVSSTMMASTPAIMAGSSRMPIVFFLGTEDPLLPWGDGRSKALGKLGETLGLSSLGSIDSPLARMGGLMSVPETIQFWTDHNGCSNSPSVTQMPNTNAKDGTTVKRETYGSGDVVVYVIDGGGHTWPGMIEISSFKDICGATTQDIDATETIWDFFHQHSR